MELRRSPTLREIAGRLEVNKSTIVERVAQLKRKGFLAPTKFCAVQAVGLWYAAIADVEAILKERVSPAEAQEILGDIRAKAVLFPTDPGKWNLFTPPPEETAA